MPSIPITIITGFLGSGKTTLLLNLLSQLRDQNPTYKLALLKNEFGDLAIDSQLANSSSISGVREILNGCICCNLVGSLATALGELADTIAPDRIVIETSGSAFPATLAMEVNRLARETSGAYTLDGVLTVIDVENWQGYADTSYTARLQARYTDLVIFNKWEEAGERRWEECLDRLGDLEVDVAWVKSRRGWVEVGVVFGLDSGLARTWEAEDAGESEDNQLRQHMHPESENHQSEVEVLSVTLSTIPAIDSNPITSSTSMVVLDAPALLKFLQTAPKDEIYRIKSIFTSSEPIPSSDPSVTPLSFPDNPSKPTKYILNWSFSRWTCAPLTPSTSAEYSAEHRNSVAVEPSEVCLRMTIILARGESKKWKKRLESDNLVRLTGGSEGKGVLQVVCISEKI